jgi:hypothetical protein
MSGFVEQHMIGIDSVRLLPEQTSVADAGTALGATPYGVVTDADGLPVAVVTAADLPLEAGPDPRTLRDLIGSLPHAVVVGGQRPMLELAEAKVVIKLFVDPRARAVAVLGDKKRVVGVVSVEGWLAYRNSPDYLQTPVHLRASSVPPAAADSLLPGSHTTPHGRIRCAECQMVNEVPFLDIDNLPDCQNKNPPPHKLKLSQKR